MYVKHVISAKVKQNNGAVTMKITTLRRSQIKLHHTYIGVKKVRERRYVNDIISANTTEREGSGDV